LFDTIGYGNTLFIHPSVRFKVRQDAARQRIRAGLLFHLSYMTCPCSISSGIPPSPESAPAGMMSRAMTPAIDPLLRSYLLILTVTEKDDFNLSSQKTQEFRTRLIDSYFLTLYFSATSIEYPFTSKIYIENSILDIQFFSLPLASLLLTFLLNADRYTLSFCLPPFVFCRPSSIVVRPA
jgi:hypothetical protein